VSDTDEPQDRGQNGERPRRQHPARPRAAGGGRPTGGRPGGDRQGGDRPARRDGAAGGARKPDAGGRPRSEGKPARDWKPRGDGTGVGGPRREWKPRADGQGRPARQDAPKREWKPQPGGQGRPTRNDGPQPERKPRGSGAGNPARRDGGGRDWKARGDAVPARDARPPRRNSGAPTAGRGGGDQRLWTRGGAPARGDRDAREIEPPEERDPFNTRSVRKEHIDPELPDSVKDTDLDRIARNELKTLTPENQEFVARHLVMAARLIDQDPALAHRHAESASRRGGRIGIVRESLAITAYAVGDYALALRELRTYRRITGRDDQLPMMVDSERGLGRPEKALELGRSVQRSTLAPAVQVELAIAMSGARLDLGQLDAALLELQIPQLDRRTAFSWSPGLFDAYATVLEDLGRDGEAEQWFAAADLAVAALQEHGDAEHDEDEVVMIVDMGDPLEAERLDD
jgi:hypothetical protein